MHNPLDPSSDSLSLQERQIRALFEHSLDAIAIADDSGRYIDVNPAACQLFGRSRSQLIGSSIAEFIEPDLNFEQVWQRFQDERQERGELRLIRADGSIREVEYSACANFLPHQHLSILRDITERKRAEAEIQALNQQLEQRVQARTQELHAVNQALRVEIQERQKVESALRESQYRLQSVLSSIEGMVWSIGVAPPEILYLNLTSEQIYGYSVEALSANPNLWLEAIYPGDRAWVEKAIANLASGDRESQTLEYRILRSDRQIRWLQDRLHAIRDRQGQIARIDRIATDITPLKQAEAALRQSEATNRAIIEAIPDLVFCLDRQGTYLTIQANAEDRLVNPEQTSVGNTICDTLPSTLAQQRLKYIHQALETQQIQIYEYSLQLRGEIRHEEARIVPMENEQVLVMVRDITAQQTALRDRLAAEASLLEERQLFFKGPIVIFKWQAAEGWPVEYVSPNISEELGYSPSDFQQGHLKFADLVHPEDVERVKQEVQDYTFTDTRFFQQSYRLRLANGEYCWLDDYTTPIFRADGTVSHYLGYVQNVTHRHQAAEALQKSETQLRLLTDTLPVCISYTDRTLRYQFVNRTYEQWFGYRREEICGCTLQEIIGLPAFGAIQSYVERVLAGETVFYEAQVPYRLGGQRYVAAILVPDLDERQSQVQGYYALISDISERKRTEAELEQTRNFLQLVLDHLPLAVYAKEAQELRFVLWNAAATELLGYSASEALGQTDADLFPPQQVESCTNSDLQALSQQQAIEIPQEQVWTKQGELKIIRNKKVGIYDLNGEPKYAIGFAEDITQQQAALRERQQAEMALQESEARFRAIFEQAGIGIVVSTLEGRLIQMNQRFCDLIGCQHSSEAPLYYQELTTPEDIQREQPQWEALLSGEISTYTIEKTYYHRQRGDCRFVNVSVSSIRNGEDRLLYVLALVEDITERKQAEAALRQQAEQEYLISGITNRIRRSLNLQEILQTTVVEIRSSLNADRALIFCLYPDGTGSIIAESVLPAYPVTRHMSWTNECFPSECYEYYRQGYTRIVCDPSRDEWASCIAEFMTMTGVKSKIVAPITQLSEDGSVRVWGLLIVHACAVSRIWQETEADLLSKISDQLAIAIQQAELCEKLQLANQELNRLASMDGLTQIANRRHFDTSLAQEWQRLGREQLPLSLILCDIDYFKFYNDYYGHPAGDRCLQQVSQALQRAVLRPADLVARYGGEEFVAILPNTDCEGAMRVAQRIQDAIALLNLPHCCSPVSDRITVSLGIASQIPRPHTSPDTLIAQADLALYKAKMQGRDRYCINETSLG